MTFIPISSLNGDIVKRCANTPWYEGSPPVYHLEHVFTGSDHNLIDAR
jgi:sulfate adenylyltransferase subunit 1 (EFTu-like GTPase family)